MYNLPTMKLTKKLLISMPLITLCTVPATFVVSCGNSVYEETVIEETKMLKTFLTNNPNCLQPSDTEVRILNFVDFNRGWENVDDFVSSNFLQKYFKCTNDFINKLKENSNQIYNQIKRLVVQPKSGSRDLTVIFYLNQSNTDKNIVEANITNALTQPFSYQNSITIPNNINVQFYDNQEQFNNDWNKISDLNTLKNILNRAFNFPADVQDKIANAINNKSMTISRSSLNQIILYIEQKGIDEGYILQKLNAQNDIEWQDITITSNVLIK